MATKRDSLFLETTTVPAAKTIGEITAVLVKSGARTIETIYENGRAAGLCWSMMLYDRPVYFRMPAKVDPVYKLLRKNAGHVSASRDANLCDQAERVAWRQMLAWVKVQMSLVEIGMVEYAQVFLPYVTDGNTTVWERFRESRLALPPPSSGAHA